MGIGKDDGGGGGRGADEEEDCAEAGWMSSEARNRKKTARSQRTGMTASKDLNGEKRGKICVYVCVYQCMLMRLRKKQRPPLFHNYGITL